MRSRLLFGDTVRTDPSVGGHEEPTWDFRDRVDDPSFARVRRTVDRWWSRYPSEERADLRGRLECGDNSQFHAAWFELYLHAVHEGLGFDVSVHPDLEGVGTHPDFRLSKGGRVQAFLEATVVGDGLDAGRVARRVRILTAIERISSPDFMLLVSIDAESRVSPPMRDLRRRVASWVRSLVWEEERARLEQHHGYVTYPRLLVRAGDWQFVIEAVARAPDRRSLDARTIGAGPADGGCFDHGHSLRARLEEKAKRCGPMTHPVVIALRHDGIGFDDRDAQTALFGPRIGVFDPTSGNVRSTGAHGEGLWHAQGRTRNRHVAGVLIFSTELRPWSITRQQPTLWLHPDPAYELPALPWSTAESTQGTIVQTPSRFDPADVLDLPDIAEFEDRTQWPGVPFLGI